MRNRKGIYQRKDGKYSARYYAKDGKRKEKYFNTLPEAKNWLADAKYEDRHNLIVTDPKMTVDKWFSYRMSPHESARVRVSPHESA